MTGAQEPFGERLRRYREAAGYSQEQLAARAGLSANAIGALERGERKRPYPDTLRRLAEALDLDDGGRASLSSALRPGAGLPRRSRAAPPAGSAGSRFPASRPPSSVVNGSSRRCRA